MSYTYDDTLGTEIKQEALRLMFATDDAKNYSSISGVNDYKDKMDGSITRAIYRICQAKKAGIKTLSIASNKFSDLKDGLDLTTAFVGANIMQIDKVSIKLPNCALKPYNSFFTIDYKTMVIEDNIPSDATLKVYYYPSYVGLSDLRADVRALIPLFVKSELYEEDESTLAVKARNVFESELEAIEINPQTIQTQVSNIFGGM